MTKYKIGCTMNFPVLTSRQAVEDKYTVYIMEKQRSEDNKRKKIVEN